MRAAQFKYRGNGGLAAVHAATDLLGVFQSHSLSEAAQTDILRTINDLGVSARPA